MSLKSLLFCMWLYSLSERFQNLLSIQISYSLMIKGLSVVYMVVFPFTDLGSQGILTNWKLLSFRSANVSYYFCIISCPLFSCSFPLKLIIWMFELLNSSQISFIFLKHFINLLLNFMEQLLNSICLSFYYFLLDISYVWFQKSAIISRRPGIISKYVQFLEEGY